MMAKHRLEKVSRAIKQAASEIILYHLRDPRLGFVTVTRVETSRDLKYAKVHVSVMGESADAKKTLQGLRHARGYIQVELSKRVPMRYVPEISFELDESVKKSIDLARLLNRLQQEGGS